VASVTDETYKISKKELQLLFLKQLYSGIEANKKNSQSEFIKDLRLSFDEYAAVQDFLNIVAKKYIEQIERLVEECKAKRKASAASGISAGSELFASAKNDLEHLKNTVGTYSVKYSSTADKVANEILQCSIDYYNENYEKTYPDGNYIETAQELAKKAKAIALGSVVKERIEKSIDTCERMKDRPLLQAIEALKLVKGAYYEYYRLDWDKVVEIIQEAIPQKNIERIKNSSNASLLREFKALVEFLFDKMPSYKSREIDYVYYWRPVAVKTRPVAKSYQVPKATDTATVTKTANPVPVTNKKEFPARRWWLIISGIVFLLYLRLFSEGDFFSELFSEFGTVGIIFLLFVSLFISGFFGFIIFSIFRVPLEGINNLMGWTKRKMSG